MPNRIEEDRGPRPEVFIVREGKKEKLLEHFNSHCRPLYGSDVRFDSEGNIFYPTWRQVNREEVEPTAYSLLSKEKEIGKVYLARELVTKKLYEQRINKVTKDGGPVEVAIRSVEHVLETELEREIPQMKVMKLTISELFDLFADFSAVTDEQLEEAQNMTYCRLEQVELNPGKVILEEKQRMVNWLKKASGGRDTLTRRNPLITAMALEAAYIRAVERELGIGQTVSKFARMREALRFERAFSRGILEEVVQRLELQSMPGHYLFKYPEKSAQNVGVVSGIVNTLRWKLTQLHVRPYRPAGIEAREILGEVVGLLKVDRRREITDKNLFGQVRNIIEEVLDIHKDVYPK